MKRYTVAEPGAAARLRPARQRGERAPGCGAGTMAAMTQPPKGKVALVAGATARRPAAGTAVALGEAGATVYCTGRSTTGRRSEYDRPETIEENRGAGRRRRRPRHRVAVDHARAGAGRALVRRIDAEQGRLDVLGQRHLGRREAVRMWKHAAVGARPRRRPAAAAPCARHALITSHCRVPLLIRQPGGLVVEMTDGTREYNDAHYRVPPSTTWPRPPSPGLPSPRPRSSRPTGAPPCADARLLRSR